MSVRQAQREISSAEFAEWMAYDRLDPIGPVRVDVAAGTIAAAVFNARRSKASDHFFTADEMMPVYWRPPVEPLSPEELFEKIKAINEAWGGDFEGEA